MQIATAVEGTPRPLPPGVQLSAFRIVQEALNNVMRHAPGADARRNRRRLVETARLVFAERGLDAPLDEIARRADVGNATLYRHFPDRRELVAAVFVDAMQEIVDATVRSLEQPDPWVAFTDHLTFLCRLQATDRAWPTCSRRPCPACRNSSGSAGARCRGSPG